MVKDADIHAVVVAAGSGSRYGGDLPKQFLELDGEPVLCHSIRTFRLTFPRCAVTVVLSDWGKEFWTDYCRRTGFEPGKIVIGGKTRSESVRNAINSIDCTPETVVMVHDGARPLLGFPLLLKLAAAAGKDCGAVPALPMTDSMIEIEEDGTLRAVPRARYRTVQTPQVFPLWALRQVYSPQADIEAYTDELSAILAGTTLPVTIIPGDKDNIKITTPGDLDSAAHILSRQPSFL